MLLLLEIAVVPNIAFFKVAYDYSVQLSAREEQIQTIAALQERERRVKKRYANLKLISASESDPGAGGKSEDVVRWLFLRRRLEQSWDRYDTSFLNGALSVFPGEREDRPPKEREPLVEDNPPIGLPLLSSLIPYRGDPSTETLVDEPRSRWYWNHEGTNRLRIRERAELQDIRSPQSQAFRKAIDNDPNFLTADLTSKLVGLERLPPRDALIAFWFACLAIFVWIRPTIRRLFMLAPKQGKAKDRTLIEIMQPNEPITEDLILLGLCYPGEADVLQRTDTVYIDTSEVIADTSTNCDSMLASTVVINRFHLGSGDADAETRKLNFIETLQRCPRKKKIVIVTTVDPLFWITRSADLEVVQAASQPESPDAARWRQALLQFKRKRLVNKTISDDHRYALLWSACTLEEQAALCQLVNDGWGNWKNAAALDQLEKRDIIVSDPMQIKEGGFGDFIRGTVTREDRRVWEKLEDVTVWDGVRLTFALILLLLLGVVLLYTQQDILAYVVSGVSILLPAVRAFAQRRGMSISGPGAGDKA